MLCLAQVALTPLACASLSIPMICSSLNLLFISFCSFYLSRTTLFNCPASGGQATVPFSMSFALLLGSAYEPYAIDEEPLSRVLFESEKDHIAAIKGKAIFDLDRFLLLSTEDKSGSHVVAIPNEKIKSIETPPLPAEQEIGGD